MHDNDQAMREFAKTLALPEFEETAFTKPPPLREARVAIVTSAALHRIGSPKWKVEDFHFETLPHDARDLKLGHLSPNFDRAGFAADMNVVYPVDRLQELSDQGGSAASRCLPLIIPAVTLCEGHAHTGSHCRNLLACSPSGP